MTVSSAGPLALRDGLLRLTTGRFAPLSAVQSVRLFSSPWLRRPVFLSLCLSTLLPAAAAAVASGSLTLPRPPLLRPRAPRRGSRGRGKALDSPPLLRPSSITSWSAQTPAALTLGPARRARSCRRLAPAPRVRLATPGTTVIRVRTGCFPCRSVLSLSQHYRGAADIAAATVLSLSLAVSSRNIERWVEGAGLVLAEARAQV